MSCCNGGKLSHAPPPSPPWTETSEVIVVAGSWNEVLGLEVSSHSWSSEEEVDEFKFDLPESLKLQTGVDCWRCNGNVKR